MSPFSLSSAILAGDRLQVFAVNRSLSEAAPVRVVLADRPVTAAESAELLAGPDAKAANSYERPELVRSRPFADTEVAGGQASFELPPLSVAATTWRLGG